MTDADYENESSQREVIRSAPTVGLDDGGDNVKYEVKMKLLDEYASEQKDEPVFTESIWIEVEAGSEHEAVLKANEETPSDYWATDDDESPTEVGS